MGSWGTGLQSNDSAADALAEFEKAIERVSDAEGARRLLARVAKEYEHDAAGVLGVAEALLDNEIDLSRSLPLLAEPLAYEMEYVRDWVDPVERLEVLEYFEARLTGRGDVPEPADRGNIGLFAALEGEPPRAKELSEEEDRALEARIQAAVARANALKAPAAKTTAAKPAPKAKPKTARTPKAAAKAKPKAAAKAKPAAPKAKPRAAGKGRRRA